MYARAITFLLICLLVIIGIELTDRRTAPLPPEPTSALLVPATMPSSHLLSHVGEIEFKDIPLNAALNLLSERSGASVAGDWEALQTLGISSTQPVTLWLHDPTLAAALEAICSKLEPWVENGVRVSEDFGGIVMLCAEDLNRLSVTTRTRFYDVDDLLGPPVPFHAPPPGLVEEPGVYAPFQCPPKLRQLSVATAPFVRQGSVGCIGRRLFVGGHLETQEVIAQILSRIRHPIQCNSSAGSPARLGQPETTSDVQHDGSEAIPRAYDVSAILAHPQPWTADVRENGIGDDSDSSEQLLLTLLQGVVSHSHGDAPVYQTKEAFSAWNGIVLVRTSPATHVQIFNFLEHLQRTGRATV